MRKCLFTSFLLAVCLAGCAGEKAEAKDQEVKALVSSYLSALEKKDISSAVKYADDLRFPDKQMQKEEYSEIFLQQSVTDGKIKKLKKVKENSYAVTIEIVENGNKATYTFPVEQKEKEWKLTVGQDTYPEPDATR